MSVKYPKILKAGLATLLLAACTSLPNQSPIAQKKTPEPTVHADTLLADIMSQAINKPEESGHILLRDGHQAFLERLYLIQMAEYSIDAQYFIWNSDVTGKLLIQQLLVAAERGVKVRLLIDGFSIGERNDQLAALASHRNIEVKIFNPFTSDSSVGNLVDFALDFDRLNQRMHNKSFIIDGIATITGGRNIGDGYFFYSDELNFNDLDLFSVGAVVKQVAQSYNNYWSSQWAVPIDQLEPVPSESPIGLTLQQYLNIDMASQLGIDLPTNDLQLSQHYRNVNTELMWAKSTYIADTPYVSEKEIELIPKKVTLSLADLMINSKREILIESAYLGFDEDALALIDKIIKDGGSVKALTNSKATNNLLVNHASYVKFRDQMLDTGVGIYELKPYSCPYTDYKVYDCDEMPPIALHAKSAVFDSDKAYIGSMNFNLRSAYLNTESAMFIESEEIATLLAEQIEANIELEQSYQMVKTNGSVYWLTSNDGKIAILDKEPSTNWLERLEVGILNRLPGVEYF